MMGTIKKELGTPANDSEIADDISVQNSEKKNPGRRLQDDIESKDPTRKLNLDRRVSRSDRRVDSDPDYKGPSRRYTIDRRNNLKDRRNKE